MGLNVSYRHFGNRAAASQDVRRRRRRELEEERGREEGRDMRDQQPWRLNQAEKRGNERG